MDGEHASDCAVNNGPALPEGPCDCGHDIAFVPGGVWLHRKSKGLYVSLGKCRLEANGRYAALYRRADDTGPLWARDLVEFMDGRFASIAGGVKALERSRRLNLEDE